ncbi:NAD(P)/FAD-dependent oxidoreductase [Saccharopolyspora hordei]|uniref:Phthalate 3,4-dioxygenase ferredoxin reductase subunit n=1 Tax=Saccharopolyspora hordei TaxID=1838 RepID=A0A853AIX8_9PSEU|nr:FAD-dependent oxidoreductase [Saccharopolyspora hordei]NYI84065.1 phthalate 3,4-dioxygenase ferredoxin reductase subunit [Saccharopolyspora hordei]
MARTVIVGASVGGVRTAQALRAEGYRGEIVLVGEEEVAPYDKPPLSKALLAGTATAKSIGMLPERAAIDAGIRCQRGRAATAVSLRERRVQLADGTAIEFDDLVVATGARARTSPWGNPPGVHVLRTLADAEELGAALRQGGPLVVIGAGFIGAEVASTAVGLGVREVTMVDPVEVPLSRVLSPGVASQVAALHERHGVTTRFGVGVTDVVPRSGGLEVRLADGSTLQAATVVVGIGAVPNDDWLDGSGITTDDGVVCDQFSRSVDDPHVWAVGDVARWWHVRQQRSVRVEHWTNAVQQAECVAHNIVHPADLRSHAPVEYVWSDQYDWKLHVVGCTDGDQQHVLVGGGAPERSFAVLYAAADGSFTGAVIVNWPKALVTCRRSLALGRVPLAQVRADVEALQPKSHGVRGAAR